MFITNIQGPSNCYKSSNAFSKLLHNMKPLKMVRLDCKAISLQTEMQRLTKMLTSDRWRDINQ